MRKPLGKEIDKLPTVPLKWRRGGGASQAGQPCLEGGPGRQLVAARPAHRSEPRTLALGQMLTVQLIMSDKRGGWTKPTLHRLRWVKPYEDWDASPSPTGAWRGFVHVLK